MITCEKLTYISLQKRAYFFYKVILSILTALHSSQTPAIENTNANVLFMSIYLQKNLVCECKSRYLSLTAFVSPIIIFK